MASWPTPLPIEGVKSRKRQVFGVAQVNLELSQAVVSVTSISLSLSSRIAAIGEAGCAVAELLLDPDAPGSAKVSRHNALLVAHLGPRQLAARTADYAASITAVLERRPHVIVLDQALEARDSEWTHIFDSIVYGEDLRTFRGAVIVRVAEAEEAPGFCTECWMAAGDCLQQRPCPHIIEDGLAGDAGDMALLMAADDEVLELTGVRAQDLAMRARKGDLSVTLLVEIGPMGSKELLGFLCYKVASPPRLELHIKYILVPQKHRGRGYAKCLMRWLLRRVSLMPRSECSCITLCALDEAEPLFDHFGFVDMSHRELDDYDQKWMVLENQSVGPVPTRPRNSGVLGCPV